MYEIKVDLSDPSKVYIWEDNEHTHQMVATIHNSMELARDIVKRLNRESCELPHCYCEKGLYK